MSAHANINALFSPRSIAVIGASQQAHKVGHRIVKNLTENNFPGQIFPINPKKGILLGLPVLGKISELPTEHQPLDLAVICLPAPSVESALTELGGIGAKAAIILSSGFKETGSKGALLEQRLRQIAARYHIAVLGPNCFGLANTASKMNATFFEKAPLPGNIGFFSQSGAFCSAMLDWTRGEQIGFSSFISLGNKMDLDESDMLHYLAHDSNTKVIAGYLENIQNGPRFLRNAQNATKKKPVILLKAGRTPTGVRAASAHSGILMEQDMALEAVFKQTGIIRVGQAEDLFSMAQAFAAQKLPQSQGLVIVSNAGGPSIIAADACDLAGLSLAQLSPHSIEQLQNLLPGYASIFNPIDVMGDASPSVLSKTLEIVLEDHATHMLLLILTPNAATPIQESAAAAAAVLNKSQKTVFSCVMGKEFAKPGKELLSASGIPCYPFPETAVKAIAAMYKQSLWEDNPLPVEVNYRHNLVKAQEIITGTRKNHSLELVGWQALNLLKAYEMPVLETKLARTSNEAWQIAKQIGLPVALKISSPHIAHKTDGHGVILDLDNMEKVQSAFLEITGRAARWHKEAYIAGCLVQSMAPPNAREVIFGFKRDPQFGPLLSFGLAGIHRQTLKDVSYRLAPLSLDDVHSMIREIKAFPLLAGLQHQNPIKFTALEDILLILSQLSLDIPEIEEAECNPVFINEHGAFISECRIILGKMHQKNNSTTD